MSSLSESASGFYKRYPGLTVLGVGSAVGYAVWLVTKHLRGGESDGVSVSAPGKALVAGGYLVLEHPNVGLVVSSTSRFFASVKPVRARSLDESARARHIPGQALLIVVQSPQFHTETMYQYDWRSGVVTQLSTDGNEFVEKCLQLVFAFLRKRAAKNKNCDFAGDCAEVARKSERALGIKLRADNDFYSQINELQKRGLPLLSSSAERLPRFQPCPKDADTGKVTVAKTGMGSSAALTTSLVGGLLKFFGAVSLTGGGTLCQWQAEHEEDRRIVHNLAQLAHAVAQGKIGSGFDVSAAVYGSQMYRRFSPAGFTECMDAYARPGGDIDGERIFAAVMDKTKWAGCQTQVLTLPQGFDIVMGDVCGGSASTSMARAVLSWRKSGGSEAATLWDELGHINVAIHENFSLLRNYELNLSSDFAAVIKHVSTRSYDQWNVLGEMTTDAEKRVIAVIFEIKRLFAVTRKLLKQMGEKAGVGIEPDSQTRLCDATEDLPGVLCAGVPGAGGVDAIFAFTFSPAARLGVEKMWSQWNKLEFSSGMVKSGGSSTVVCPLMLHAETNPSSAGIRSESLRF